MVIDGASGDSSLRMGISSLTMSFNRDQTMQFGWRMGLATLPRERDFPNSSIVPRREQRRVLSN